MQSNEFSLVKVLQNKIIIHQNLNIVTCSLTTVMLTCGSSTFLIGSVLFDINIASLS